MIIIIVIIVIIIIIIIIYHHGNNKIIIIASTMHAVILYFYAIISLQINAFQLSISILMFFLSNRNSTNLLWKMTNFHFFYVQLMHVQNILPGA